MVEVARGVLADLRLGRGADSGAFTSIHEIFTMSVSEFTNPAPHLNMLLRLPVRRVVQESRDERLCGRS